MGREQRNVHGAYHHFPSFFGSFAPAVHVCVAHDVAAGLAPPSMAATATARAWRRTSNQYRSFASTTRSRQLTASQRAMIVAETLNIRQHKQGGDRRSQD